MATETDWEQLDLYDYTDALDDPDWGWEFLRRFTNYHSDFAALQQVRAQFGDAAAAIAELATGQRWGLRFCRGPEPPRDRH